MFVIAKIIIAGCNNYCFELRNFPVLKTTKLRQAIDAIPKKAKPFIGVYILLNGILFRQ